MLQVILKAMSPIPGQVNLSLLLLLRKEKSLCHPGVTLPGSDMTALAPTANRTPIAASADASVSSSATMLSSAMQLGVSGPSSVTLSSAPPSIVPTPIAASADALVSSSATMLSSAMQLGASHPSSATLSSAPPSSQKKQKQEKLPLEKIKMHYLATQTYIIIQTSVSAFFDFVQQVFSHLDNTCVYLTYTYGNQSSIENSFTLFCMMGHDTATTFVKGHQAQAYIKANKALKRQTKKGGMYPCELAGDEIDASHAGDILGRWDQLHEANLVEW